LILVAAGAGGWALRDRLEPDANAAGADSTNPVPEAFAATPPGVNAGLRDRAERGDASAQASLALAEAGTVVSYQLTFTPQRAGLAQILVRLRNADAAGVETVYAIPLLVAAAPAG